MFSKSLKRLGKAAIPYLDSSPIDTADSEGDVFHDTDEAALHPDASPDSGGLACNDSQLLSRQRSAIMQVLKTLGKNLLSGNLDLLKISLPVVMCEPRSYLQKLADPWVYSAFLRAAALAEDPVERLQWTVTFIVAGLHRAFLHFEKPFNPILGETHEAFLPDGSRIYLEQVSHHPPISAFELRGPQGRYIFRGHSQPSVSYKTSGGLSIKTVAHGYRQIEFADGTAIQISYPSYYIKGLLLNSSPRAEISGEARFVDPRHGLTATIRFGPVEGSSSALLRRGDAFSGVIAREFTLPRAASSPSDLDHTGSMRAKRSGSSSLAGLVRSSLTLKPGKSRVGSMPVPSGETMDGAVTDSVQVAMCTGNWLSHMDWDGRRFWTLADDQHDEWQPEQHLVLPSDSRCREDLTLLAAGKVQAAQQAKDLLEQRQRADAKLRKEGMGLSST